jgi:hypothetical protein
MRGIALIKHKKLPNAGLALSKMGLRFRFAKNC